MDLRAKQKELQNNNLDVLKKKLLKKINTKVKKTSETHNSIGSKYLKTISGIVKKYKKEGLINLSKKLFEASPEKYKTILSENIKLYRLKDRATEYATNLFNSIENRSISYILNLKHETYPQIDQKMICELYKELHESSLNTNTIKDSIKEKKQLFTIKTFLLRGDDLAFSLIQSMVNIHYTPTQKETTNKSKQNIADTMAEDILKFTKYQYKKDKRKSIKELDQSDKIDLGTVCLDILFEANMIEESELIDTEFKTVSIKDDFLKDEKTFVEELYKFSRPLYEPMICEPDPWSDIDKGGYLPLDFDCPKYDLNIMKTSFKHQREFLESQRGKFSPKIFDAINTIQNTSYRINQKILDVVQKEFLNEKVDNKEKLKDLGSNIKKLQQKNTLLKELIVEDNDSQEIVRRHKDKINKNTSLIKELKIEKNKLNNDIKILELKLNTADKFKSFPHLYFVWQIDFRGRVYPIQALLNPQGDDLSKSLLYFSTKKPLGLTGEKWFKIHGANLYGEDKLSFEDRLNWIEQNHQEILDVANQQDPLSSEFLKNADKKYQFLAFCFEYNEFIVSPATFKSALPIALDGTNNGFQHVSVLLKDIQGAKKVNVLPSDTNTPADLYSEVALSVKELIREEKDDKKLEIINKLTDTYIDIDRSLVKSAVMIDSYGASDSTKTLSIKEYINKKEPDIKEPDIKEYSNLLGVYTNKAIKKVAPSSAAYKKYMKHIITKIYKKHENKALIWTTPLKLRVLMDERKMKKLTAKVFNSNMQIREVTNEVNIPEQSKGIAPNFVHSLDATHMYMTVLKAKEKGIDCFALIHDSFATHACNTQLLHDTIKDSFIELAKSTPLESLKKEIETNYEITLDDIPIVDDSFSFDEIQNSSYIFN